MDHTPGPWKLVTYAGHKHKSGDWVGCIEDPNGEKVYAGAFSFHAIHNLANATLIAAAPDLLAACMSALESTKIARQVLPEGSIARGAFDGAFIGVCQELDTAIVRARGESNG